MSTEFFCLPDETTVQQAIDALQQASDVEMVFYVYVVDRHNHLVGVLSLRQLLMVPPSRRLKEIMVTDVISVRTNKDQEEAAQLVERYNILALPVLDRLEEDGRTYYLRRMS